jgi:alpha-glucoside transport system substrate-binding protein
MDTRSLRLPLVLLLTILVALAGLPPAAAQYNQITILAQWDSRAEQDDFQQLLLPFFQEHNIQPNLIAASNLEKSLYQQVQAGTPPDMVLMTQPGLLRAYVESGQVIALDAALGPPPDGYPAYLADAVTVDGIVYGRFVRLTVKGLAWYNSAGQMAASVPRTWDDLLTVSHVHAGQGREPWALGLSTGVIGTDILETILVRQHGADVVNGLADGLIPWTDERVRAAWEVFGEMLDTGVLDDPTRLSPADAVLAPFDDPAAAAFAIGPSTALRWITSANRRLTPGADVDFFALPAGDRSGGVVIGGDFIVLFNDDPIVLQLAEYLASPEAAAAWADLGSAISPYPGADYPNGVLRDAAALTERGDPVFDLSDRLHPDARDSLYGGIWRYVDNRGSLDDVLIEIESAVGKTR